MQAQAVGEAEALIPSLVTSELELLGLSYPRVKLLDICDLQGGTQPPKSKFLYEPTEGYVRFLQIRDYSSNDFKTYVPISRKNRLVSSKEILVGRYGASLGKILRGKEGAYNVALCKVIPKTNDVDSDFLAVTLAYGPFQMRLKQVKRSAQVGFNREDLKDVNFVIPPLDNQHRIVAHLDQVQARVDALKQLQEKSQAELDALLPSVLDKAFRGEL